MFAKYTKQFSTLIWPVDYWNLIDFKQQEIANKFLVDIESSLGLKHTEVSFNNVWKKEPPKDAGDQTLHDYMIKGRYLPAPYRSFD